MTHDIAELDLPALRTAMETAAKTSAEGFLKKHYNGQDWGACGFAWVTIYPKHKGNTKEGREERKVYRALGAELDHTGKNFQIWNPAKIGCQNIDAKEEGATTAAKILQMAGIDAHSHSRLD